MATMAPFQTNGIQLEEPRSPFALPTPLPSQRPEHRDEQNTWRHPEPNLWRD